jgi:superfamily I DNA/RNA helicase
VVLSVFRLLEGVGSYLDLETAASHLSGGLKPQLIKQLTQWGIAHDYSVQQVLDIARRLPLPGMEKKNQRKIGELIRTLATCRKELAACTMPEKLEGLARRLHLSEFDATETPFQDMLAHLPSADGSRPGTFEWISRICLQTDTDRYNPRAEKVSLLTMHAAKGLEFPVVFVTGCEDDLIPLRMPKKPDSNIDEERRLFYVAMTRAKELLYLSYCRKRTLFGRMEARRPSPFLVDIENRLKSYDKSSSSRPTKKRPEQLRLF